MPKDIKKNAGQIWKQHYKISFKKMSNLCRKYHFHSVSAGQNTILTKPKELFSYGNPFDRCLIMKNWNPRKFLWMRLFQIHNCFPFQHQSCRGQDRTSGNLNCLSENILSSLLHHKRFITITQPSYKTSSPLELFFNWISHIKSYDSPCQMEWIP